MPASSPLGKDIIKEWFSKQKDILSILDVGAGEGTYRKLLGDKYRWKAIEVWGDYIKRYHLRDMYDEILTGDIRKIEWPMADCVIFGDVIEHLSKKDGIGVLERATEGHRHVVVSIPIGEYKQGAIEGNPYERHKSTWYWEDFGDEFLVKKLIPYCDTCPKDKGIGIFIK